MSRLLTLTRGLRRRFGESCLGFGKIYSPNPPDSIILLYNSEHTRERWHHRLTRPQFQIKTSVNRGKHLELYLSSKPSSWLRLDIFSSLCTLRVKKYTKTVYVFYRRAWLVHDVLGVQNSRGVNLSARVYSNTKHC